MKRSVNFSKAKRINQHIKPEFTTKNVDNAFKQGRPNYVSFLKKVYYSLNNDEKLTDENTLQGWL